MKNYFGFVNDHSGSMQGGRARQAIQDYNTNIGAVKDAASREMLDTVVNVIGVGLGQGYRSGHQGYGVKRQVVVSNPHVLKPLTDWPTPGGTPLWDGVGDMIELLESLPDANDPNVSFVIMTTTDGEEGHSEKYTAATLSAKINELQRDGRWTFVFRVPKGASRALSAKLGVPIDNIQEWDTTATGLQASTAATSQAINNFFVAKAAGVRGSNTFYTSTAAVDTSKLAALDKTLYSLYVVEDYQDGIQIKDFILSKRAEYMVGGAFYQLTKTEARVSPTKLILIRDRATDKVYSGSEARKMLGLDTVNNARIHPNHGGGGYDIFIQSESVNRKLVKGTGILYMPSIGRKMTQADIDKYVSQAKPSVPVLPDAPATGRPTPSPVAAKKAPTAVAPVSAPRPTPGPAQRGGRVRYHAAPPVTTVSYYSTREQARQAARLSGKRAYDAGPAAGAGRRHYVA